MAAILAVSGESVILTSSLKQTTLCPGDSAATFTCIANGTDLTWIVGGSILSYNANADVGALRTFSGVTAILLQIEELQSNGYGRRLSVLTIKAQPQASDALVVQCHNGTASAAKNSTFVPSFASDPLQPEDVLTKPVASSNGAVIIVSWTEENMSDIDHFEVQVDRDAPVLVQNITTTLLLEGRTNATVHVVAVDKCGLVSEKANTNIIYLQGDKVTIDDNSTQEGMERTNSAMKIGSYYYCLVVIIAMCLFVLS